VDTYETIFITRQLPEAESRRPSTPRARRDRRSGSFVVNERLGRAPGLPDPALRRRLYVRFLYDSVSRSRAS